MSERVVFIVSAFLLNHEILGGGPHMKRRRRDGETGQSSHVVAFDLLSIQKSYFSEPAMSGGCSLLHSP